MKRFKTVFQNAAQKTEQYNRFFKVCNQVRDPDTRKELGKAFDEIRRANREWDKVIANIRE